MCDYYTSDAKLLHNSGLYLTGSAARNKAERSRGKLPKVIDGKLAVGQNLYKPPFKLAEVKLVCCICKWFQICC